jgi:hypothetical protein
MKRICVVCSLIGLLGAGTLVVAQGGGVAAGLKTLRTALIGFEEVPVVSTVASGSFQARISNDDSSIDFELTYDELEGAVQQAHIHVGQGGVNGGISAWLCSNLASPPTPPNTQACPAPPATVTGTITAANVVGPAGQGVAAEELDELIAAIRAGKAYANVHSSKFPGGEIRGQLPHGLH